MILSSRYLAHKETANTVVVVGGRKSVKNKTLWKDELCEPKAR